jgi:hypothetical protein
VRPYKEQLSVNGLMNQPLQLSKRARNISIERFRARSFFKIFGCPQAAPDKQFNRARLWARSNFSLLVQDAFEHHVRENSEAHVWRKKNCRGDAGLQCRADVASDL